MFKEPAVTAWTKDQTRQRLFIERLSFVFTSPLCTDWRQSQPEMCKYRAQDLFITVPHHKMPVCAVYGCNNAPTKHWKAMKSNHIFFLRFQKVMFQFADNGHMLEKRKDRFSLKNAVICAKHFESSNYSDTYLMQEKFLPISENYQRLIPRLKPDAVHRAYFVSLGSWIQYSA